jgi:hypothetical protein
MCVPLWVICAAFIGITHRNTLHVWLAQKAKHDAETLGSDADESNIDLVARRNITRAAQHSAWHD